MEYCDWCKKSSKSLVKVSSLGNDYKVCPECHTAFSNGVCRVCGETLGLNSLEGCCILCAQRDFYEVKKKQEEVSNGLDPEIQKLYSSSSIIDENDFNRWMTFGQGNFTPESQKRNRQNWIRNKLSTSEFWTPELIELNMDDIEILMDRNFSKIFGRKYVIIYMTESNAYKFVECVDKEGRVLLVDVKEMGNNK